MLLRYLCGHCGCHGDRSLDFWVVFLDFVTFSTVVDEVVILFRFDVLTLINGSVFSNFLVLC